MADYTVRGDTRLDASGFNSGLSKMAGLAKSGLGAIAAAGAAAVTAVSGGAAASIKLASDLAEVQNVVKVTFDENEEAVNRWAEAARDAYGLSTLQAKQYTGTMGAMLKSMGLTDDAVLQMSTDMAGLAGDFASFYNLNAEDAFYKIRAGISGETEPLKQLGINMSVANLEAFALSQGIDKAYNSMSQAEQATLRYNYLMSVSADAQDDFVNTQGSLANQMRIASLQVQEMGAAIGQSLLPMATEALKTGNELLTALREGFESGGIEGLMDATQNVVQQLAERIAQQAPALVSSATSLLLSFTQGLINAIPTLATAGIQIVQAVGAALVTAAPDLAAAGWQMLQALYSLFASAAPQMLQAATTLVGQLGQGLVAGIPALAQNALPVLLGFTDSLRSNFGQIVDAGIGFILNLMQGIMNSLPTLLAYVPQIVSNLAGLINDNAPKLLAAAGNLILMLIQGLIAAVPSLLENMGNILKAVANVITAINWIHLGTTVIKAIGSGLKSMAGHLSTMMGKTFKGAIDYIKSLPKMALQWGKDMIQGFINGIFDSIGGIIDAVKNVGSTIASYLHFSRPDVGPLRNYETWMPDFMHGLAAGVEAASPEVESAVDRMAAEMMAAANLAASNAQNQVGTAAVAKVTEHEPTPEPQNKDREPRQFVQNINFYEPVPAPDETARAIRIQESYGLAGDQDE